MKLFIAQTIFIMGIAIPFAQAASGTVDNWLQSEGVEICHREGGTPETCGDLPLD
jgi:hypothetical protein